jgi:two-component system response regulator PilR (NtrC family)
MKNPVDTKAHVLVVDDEPDIRELLEITLGRMGLATTTAKNIATARQALGEQSFDLCLTDMKLPDGNGISLVEYIQQHFPKLPVAVITAYGSMEIAISALKAGAFDFISKPIALETLRSTIQAALNLEQTDRNAFPAHDTLLLGDTAVMEQLRTHIAKLARSQAPVYIHGESGSGKELVARAIHNESGRANGPFIAVNCGAIPRELMESEFFGHKKGSFTGAIADKTGLFQAAQGGTLFLDEVADLPLDMQVKLLRAIQEKSVRPVGSEKETAVDVRLLSATHKDLQQEVAAGRFRQDLFFRINVIQATLPSLRERKDDIAVLARHFLSQFNRNKPVKVELDASAEQALREYSFPGNVRELENILERACTLCENSTIFAMDLKLTVSQTVSRKAALQATPAFMPPAVVSPPQTEGGFIAHPVYPVFTNLEQYMDDIERSLLTQALNETRWNKTATAQRLGISFRQLRYKLARLGLE